jgi:hypothetical protein
LELHPFHLPYLTSFASSNSYLAYLLGHQHQHLVVLPFPFPASFASFNSYLDLLHLLPSFIKPFSSCFTYQVLHLCFTLTIISPYS